jgi:hypothetical protein
MTMDGPTLAIDQVLAALRGAVRGGGKRAFTATITDDEQR